MSRCFVIQPFDGGDFDDRFDQVLHPSIVNAGLDPYRVDRDPSANIPIERIEEEIRASAAVIADISVDNPNVWLEVGFAIALSKPCCLICGPTRDKFPFDIAHRRIIRYQVGTPDAFKRLGTAITERLRALIVQAESRREALQEVVSGDWPADIEKHEIAILVSIASAELTDPEGATGGQIEQSISEAGFNRLAAGLGVRSLAKRGFITQSVGSDFNGNSYRLLRLSDAGEAWMIGNVTSLALVEPPKKNLKGVPMADEDIPF